MGWIVPIANLFMPHQVVQDLNRRTLPGDGRGWSPLVLGWWITFVVMLLLDRTSLLTARRIENAGTRDALLSALRTSVLVELVYCAVLVLAAGLAIGVVETITRRVRAVGPATDPPEMRHPVGPTA